MIGVVVARKLVLRQQLAHLHLHQLQQLRVVHHVRLVHVHHDVRHPHLARQQNVLARLRHRTVRRRHHQDRPVHLRRTRDHVLHVVRVPGTVHVRVVPLRALVLHVRRRNRDPARLLLRRVVDLVELRPPPRTSPPSPSSAPTSASSSHGPHDRSSRHSHAAWSARISLWPSTSTPESTGFGQLNSADVLFDDGFGDARRRFRIARELHRIRRAALALRAQVGGVAEHLRQRHLGADRSCPTGVSSMPCKTPRRRLRSPMTSPM